MNRTIKFQLSNLKASIIYTALITYGGLGLMFGTFYLLDPSATTTISNQPIWLNLLIILAAPLFLFSIVYALWDGMISFDASLRFGTARQSYFITQLFIYIILSLLVSAAAGVSEVEWAGSASTYFAIIGENYLSLAKIVTEFLGILLLAVLTLAFYRFKAKAFIPVVVLFVLFIMTLSFSGSIESPFLFEMIINIINIVAAYKAFFVALAVVGLVGVYYLFITTTEIQD